jgi:(p)ppGpp synthase/HD superfamily hydrolase
MADAYRRSFDRALVLAALVHEGVPRKGTVVPYIIHPVHVAALLLRHGYGEPLPTAAILHDVLEDIDYTDGRLQLAIQSAFPKAGLPDRIVGPGEYRTAFEGFVTAEFDGDVMALVHAMTEPKNDGGPRRPWRERKQHVLDHLREAPEPLVALKSADALHNVRSILEDIEHHGADVLNRFRAAPPATHWYYDAIARIASARLKGAAIADELTRAADELGRFVSQLPRSQEGE